MYNNNQEMLLIVRSAVSSCMLWDKSFSNQSYWLVGEWNKRKCGEEKGRRSRSKEGRRWWRNKEREGRRMRGQAREREGGGGRLGDKRRRRRRDGGRVEKMGKGMRR